MRRWIALAVGATAVIAAAGPVAAASAAPASRSSPPATSTPAPPTDALGLAFTQAGGPGLAVTLDAGASEQHDLVISNRTSNLRLSVKLSATDATGGAGAGTSAWIAFGADVVQLDPHSSRTVPVTLSIPHDTQPGQALAHVTARVESATLASDGSPRTVTSHKTLPVSMTVNGAPTAQIAIADVHRVDKDSTHQIGIVMRNFGDQGARVTGQVVVAGDHPQTHGFSAELAPRRDTTLLVPWDAPSKDVATDISITVDYGGGDTALWSSRLGGPPATVDTEPQATATETPTSAATNTATATTSGNTTSIGPAKAPWWKKAAIPGIVIAAIVFAALWFVFELRSSRRRRETMPMQPPFFVVPGGGDASVELAKQLVALTEVIVRLVTRDEESQETHTPRARARSPDADTPPASAASGVIPTGGPTWSARAGPTDPARAPSDDFSGSVPTPDALAQFLEAARSAPPAAGDESRPDPEPTAPPALAAVPDPPEVVDPTAEALRRLTELDRERRRMRQWMDESEDALGGWPSDEELDRFANRRETDD
jgi:hypothetical protein